MPRRSRVEVFLGRPDIDLFTPPSPKWTGSFSPVPSHLAPNHSLVFLFRAGWLLHRLHQGSAEAGAPCAVPSSKKPPSLQDARRGPGRGTAVRRRTSFYLPKDAVKHLHVLSRTRAREVIEALLRKFLVVDDPRKVCTL